MKNLEKLEEFVDEELLPIVEYYYYIFLVQTLQTVYDIAGLDKCIWIAKKVKMMMMMSLLIQSREVNCSNS